MRDEELERVLVLVSEPALDWAQAQAQEAERVLVPDWVSFDSLWDLCTTLERYPRTCIGYCRQPPLSDHVLAIGLGLGNMLL